jgi:hypothetical protein
VAASLGACLFVAAWSGVLAGPASAAWSAPRSVEPGVSPVVAFGPSGDAAIGTSVNSSCGDVIATHIAVRPAHGAFAAPVTVGPRRRGCGDWPGLLAFGLPRDGATVAVFGPLGSDEQPIDAFVRAPHAGRFAAVQQLAPLGNSSADAVLPNTTAVVDTARGEVVEVGQDDAEHLSTATLSPGRTRFVISRPPAGLEQSSDVELATDGAGGTFLAGDGDPVGCTTVAYRPAEGVFTTRYQTSDCNKHTANNTLGIAAAGHGYAALLSQNTDFSSTTPLHLLIQVGRYGSFGTPTPLTAALAYQGSPLGVASDRDGAVTVAWRGCTPGPIRDGIVTLHTCRIYGETGSVFSGFGGQPTLIAPNSPHTRLSGLVADGAVVVQSCRQQERCTIAATLAQRDGGFAPPELVTASGRHLLALESDGCGDLVLVWSDDRGVLRAATRAASARRFSAPHDLSGPGAGGVTAAYGPLGEAIIAWSHAGHTIATVWRSTGSCRR